MTRSKQPAGMGRKRDDSGQYVETVAPENVLEVFAVVEGPAATSSDVAEHLECSTEAARQKLRDLVDEGMLARRKTGRTVLYWRAGGDESELSSEIGRSVDTTVAKDDGVEIKKTPTAEEGPSEEKAREETETEPELGRVVDDALSDDVDAGKRAAVQGCVEYLREQGTAEQSDFVENVFPGQTAGYASSEGWWNQIGNEYLRVVAAEYTPVSLPEKEGSDIWRWRSDF